MLMKMSQLTKVSDTPKSTILYYIKEGLLPEPHKPKPNQHLYEESCVEMIEFIKYLQNHFGLSISEIKTIVHHKDFDFNKAFEILLGTLDVIMGKSGQETIDEKELCKRFGISENKLQEYIDQGLLFKRDGYFTQKELEIVEILCEGEANGIDTDILQSYIEHARQLAMLEVKLGNSLLKDASNRNKALKSLFDTTLILKPYLFNMYTLRTYQSQKDSIV
ncbi:MAG: MerR family transcriptional regulator [Sulfurimonas sp.]|nr:MerR family transcriptional regulator [Sulfurimonas sp.]